MTGADAYRNFLLRLRCMSLIDSPNMKRIFAPAILLSFMATACAQDIETRVNSVGVADAPSGIFMISTTDETPEDVRRAYPLVVKRLADKGYGIAKEAPLHLQITVDARNAALALGDATGATSLSTAKKRKPLQSCVDKEYRVGITLTRVADGTEIYRGRAAEYHCKMTLSEALPALVAAAAADLGAPRGGYAITRQGVD